MLVHKNGSSLCQTPPLRKSQFSNSQTERAVVQAQTRTRQLRSLGLEGRKRNSILINHCSEPLPLIKLSASHDFPHFARKTFQPLFRGSFFVNVKKHKNSSYVHFLKSMFLVFILNACTLSNNPCLCVVSVTALLCCCDNTSC